MTVILRPIDGRNWREAIKLAVAAQLYASLGFEDTGRVEDGETVVRLSVDSE